MSDFDYSKIGKSSSLLASQASQANQTDLKSNSKLDQADFLKLLTTQLANQDPSSPVDNNQMVTTMSQLSVVENLSAISSNVDNAIAAINSSSALSASSLIGRSVLVDSKNAYFNGSSAGIKVSAGDGAADIKIDIKDASGSVVASFSGGVADGDFDFNWDGVIDRETGEKAPKGMYTFSITAEQEGKIVNLPFKTYANVGSVTLGSTPSETVLNLVGAGSIPLSKVEQIAES